MNTIFIHDFRVETRIGVYDWEKVLPQTLRLDVDLACADEAAFASGDLADAIDYTQVVARLRRFAAEHRCGLLERFADEAARIILAEFPVTWVRLRVAKLAVLPGVREIGVSVERRRDV